MVRCPICFLQFSSNSSYYGHKNTCGTRKEFKGVVLNSFSSSNANDDNEVNFEDDFELNIEDDNYFNSEVNDDDSSSANFVEPKYKFFQDVLLDSLQEQRKDMPSVKKSDGVYAHGNRRIYNRLIKYTAPRTQLSEDDNTELITMIKAISRINGTEIPLPSRYLHSFDISNVLKGLCLCV